MVYARCLLLGACGAPVVLGQEARVALPAVHRGEHRRRVRAAHQRVGELGHAGGERVGHRLEHAEAEAAREGGVEREHLLVLLGDEERGDARRVLRREHEHAEAAADHLRTDGA